MNILIAGCGYIGLPLGINLKSRGHEVTGWVFSETSGQKVSSSGLQVIVDDLRSPQSWARYQQQFDAIFYCPSTRGGSPEDYQQIYVDGMKQSIGALKPGGTFFYTGSTSVFSQTDGSLVDESSPTEPGSGNGSILLQAEQVALSAGGLVLRLSAIYGEGRGIMLRRYLEASGPVPGNPDRYLNQIHRDDAVSAALFLLEHHPKCPEVFNVSDDCPTTHRDILAWIAQTLNRPPAEFNLEPVSRKRGDSNRRISNRKLRALGWQPTYPSFREGYQALLPTNPTIQGLSPDISF